MNEDFTPGFGRQLAEAREAKGLTVAQVADKLKLTSRQIEALEAEDFTRLPAMVFVRGFIRNYARLVELPKAQLSVIAETPAEPTETITAHSEELRFNASPVRRWLLLPIAAAGLFLLLVAALYAWLSQGEEAYVASEPVVSSQPLSLPPVAEAQAPAMPSSATDAALPATDVADMAVSTPLSPAPSAPAVVPAAPVAAPVTASPAAPPAQPVQPAAATLPAHTVQMIADQTDSWIEVVSGDDKRYTRLLRVGEQLTLRGAAPFRLVVGNAATVRLTYDGRAIDLKPHTGDKVARLTLE